VNIEISDFPEAERGYRLSAERIADLIQEYVRYRRDGQIPQPYLDMVSALSELAALRNHVGFLEFQNTSMGESLNFYIESFDHPESCDRVKNEMIVETNRLRSVLESIAKNACCDKCQEAALVARAALTVSEGQK
jgi:hypothetical protein